MKVHEQRDQLVRAIELALPELRSGPPNGAFGIAREDCALVHMDYFVGIEAASYELLAALAAIRGATVPEVHKALGLPPAPCDCPSCVGQEAAQVAREKHRAAYTNVRLWKDATA